MKKINLLYVITKLELGGAQKHLLSLIELLDKERFNVFLFTAQEGLLMRQASSISGLRIKRSIWLERPISPFKDFLSLIEIYRFIKNNNIDMVHTHSSKAGLLGRFAARLANVKVILHTVHGWSFNDYQLSILRSIFVWLEKIASGFSNKIIVVSNHDKQKGLAVHIGSEDKYALIRYGIDYGQFRQKDQDIRNILGLAVEDLVVGTVSCLKPQKSPRDFIRLAFLVNQGLPNVKFILAGDGQLRGNIEELIDKLGLRSKLFLVGWRNDIPAILNTLDVFVLTSLWEGLPISVLEAAACGKPVIATNTGGISEVIREGKTGFLVPPGDMDNMAKRLIILLQDSQLRKTIGKNAKDSLGPDFTLSNMARNTQDLYNYLLS